MNRTANILLRVALAFAFAYPAYGFWTNQNDWVGYIPSFVKSLGVSQDMLILGIMALHLILAVWLLSGWRVVIPSTAAAAFLFSVVYFNQNQFSVLFRDVSLGIAALALAFSPRERY